MNRISGVRVTGPFRPPTYSERIKASLKELGWPPPSTQTHVPGLPQPEPRQRLSIREPMGTVPVTEAPEMARTTMSKPKPKAKEPPLDCAGYGHARLPRAKSRPR
jgi:hypothetical protein